MKINNITQYKQAKIIVKDLEELISVLDNSLNQLNKFKKYNTIRETLTALDDSRTILGIQYLKYKRILDSKGEI